MEFIHQVKKIQRKIHQIQKNKVVTQDYKRKIDFEKRKTEAERIMAKYPSRLPIICEPYKLNDPEIDRRKYLIPDDLLVTNFFYVIRKRLKISEEESLYFFCNNKILNMSDNLANVYDRNHDEDGFLYIKYTSENTFG